MKTKKITKNTIKKLSKKPLEGQELLDKVTAELNKIQTKYNVTLTSQLIVTPKE